MLHLQTAQTHQMIFHRKLYALTNHYKYYTSQNILVLKTIFNLSNQFEYFLLTAVPQFLALNLKESPL